MRFLTDSGSATRTPARSRSVSTRLLQIGASLAALAMSTGVALLAAELAVRLASPQPLILRRPDVWYPVAGIGWDRRPDLDTTVNFGGAGVVRLLTDDEGNRVGAKAPVASPELRVLAIGDSFVEALQVEYEDTTTARLEDAIAAATGRRVRVESAGVGGWNPNQYRLKAAQRVAQRSYDLLLVFLYTENDVLVASADWLPPRHPAPVHDLRMPRDASFGELRDAVLYPVNDWLEVHSQAFILSRKSLDSLLAAAGLTAKSLPFSVKRADAARDWWDVTAGVCADIARAAGERGVPTVFVLIPPAYLFLDEPMTELGYDPETMDLEQPHRLIREKMLSRGLSVIDLLPAFRDRAARGGRCYGDVDSHLSAEGHRVATEAIAPDVIARLSHGTERDPVH